MDYYLVFRKVRNGLFCFRFLGGCRSYSAARAFMKSEGLLGVDAFTKAQLDSWWHSYDEYLSAKEPDGTLKPPNLKRSYLPRNIYNFVRDIVVPNVAEGTLAYYPEGTLPEGTSPATPPLQAPSDSAPVLSSEEAALSEVFAPSVPPSGIASLEAALSEEDDTPRFPGEVTFI